MHAYEKYSGIKKICAPKKAGELYDATTINNMALFFLCK